MTAFRFGLIILGVLTIAALFPTVGWWLAVGFGFFLIIGVYEALIALVLLMLWGDR